MKQGIAAAVMLVLAAGGVGAATEESVFGKTRSVTAAEAPATDAGAGKTDKANKADTDKAAPANAAARKTENESKKLQGRDEARLLYERFNGGDMLYASKLRDAANRGNPWAAMQYGYLAHKGRLPGKKGPDYTLAQRAYLKAVKTRDNGLTGNYLAAYNLGVLHFNGGGSIKKDPAAALRWFQTAIVSYREMRKSKTAVFWPASAYAAQILTNGYGIKPDKAAARPYWLDAVKGNEPVALHGFAQSVFHDNPFTAMTYFRRAADRQHVASMLIMARWYAHADKFHQAEPVQAASWLLRATHYDKRHGPTTDAVMSSLDAKSRKKARDTAAQWLRSRGLKQAPFDYASPLNDDPAPIR